MEKEKLCLRCMRRIGNNKSCPYCQHEANVPQEDPYLPLKTVVGERYLIGKAISMNGEGITYNAFDLELKKPVTLREFFPKGLLTRGEGNYCLVNVGKATEFIDAKDSFVKLWNKLANLKGYTALTPATDIFEDLGTVYTVTEFLGEGKTLREYLLENEYGYISWEEARVLLMPVISALGELHAAGIIHGAISPTNLVIDTNGRIRITGYGIPEIRSEKTPMECEIFDGYAAVEQYGLSSGISPATDVYGFAAVLYRVLVGSTPISASSRLANDKLMIPGKFAEQLPAYVINALVNALQILPEDRTQNFEELRDELSASPAAQALSSNYELDDDYSDEPLPLLDEDDEGEYENYPSIDEAEKKKKTIIIAVVSAVVSLIVLVLIVVGVKSLSNKNKDESVTDDTSVQDITESTEATEDKFINLPDFTGELYENIKGNKNYEGLLIFETEYVDSEMERGTVVSQTIIAGTMITSIDPRTIVLKISNGLEVPSVVGDLKADAVATLKEAGFKNVRAESTKVATKASQSLKVYSVVYENPETGKWAELPSDRRLSSGDTIIVYYYGQYVAPTAAPTTTTTQPATEPSTEASTEPSTDAAEEPAPEIV